MTTRSVFGMVILAAVLAVACGDDDNPSSPSTLSNSGGTSSGSGSCRPAAVPTGLRVTAKNGNVVELSWNAVTGATGYTLLIGSVPGGTDVLNANTVNATFRFTARDGKQYARVQSESRCGPSVTSPSIEFSVP
jgi:hypothetical protein